MKTLTELKKLTDAELKKLAALKKLEVRKPGEIKKTEEKIRNYKHLAMYLEANPREDSILQEIDRLQHLIIKLDDQARFLKWYEGKTADYKHIGHARNAYERRFEIKKLQNQVKTLQFLTDNNIKSL